MPRGDRTGPAGMGQMTGRAAGFCAGYGVPGYANPAGGRMGAAFGWGGGRGYGRGYGRGLGRGYGRGRFWGAYPVQPPAYGPYAALGYPSAYPPQYAPGYSKEQEKEILENQVTALEGQMETLRKRLDEIDSGEEDA